MRGGRSLLILLVLAVGLGAYIYFVESKRDLTRSGDAQGQGLHGRHDEDRGSRSPRGQRRDDRPKKTGDVWQIIAPAGVAADSAAIGSLVSSLETLEVQSVVDEKPASVKDFGLEPARFTVAFKVAGDATAHRLNVGEKTPTGGDLYARVEASRACS